MGIPGTTTVSQMGVGRKQAEWPRECEGQSRGHHFRRGKINLACARARPRPSAQFTPTAAAIATTCQPLQSHNRRVTSQKATRRATAVLPADSYTQLRLLLLLLLIDQSDLGLPRVVFGGGGGGNAKRLDHQNVCCLLSFSPIRTRLRG